VPFLTPFNFANIRRFGHFLRLVGEKNGSIFSAHASWQAKHLKSLVLLSLGITIANQVEYKRRGNGANEGENW
jgi:hypothetical protein